MSGENGRHCSGGSWATGRGRRIYSNFPKGKFFLYLDKQSEANGTQSAHKDPIIRAIGYLSGQILHLGPKYSSLVGSSRAQQD